MNGREFYSNYMMDNISINGTDKSNPEFTTFRLAINSIYLIIGIFGIFCNGLVLITSFNLKQNHRIFMSVSILFYDFFLRMEENVATNLSIVIEEAATVRLFVDTVYVIFGLLGILFNIFVLFYSLQSKQKLNIFLAGLAFFDLINSLGYFAYGIRALIVARLAPVLMAPLQCMLQGIHITLFEIGESASSLMTMFVSLDRLIAMVFINYYRNLKTGYIGFIIGFVSTYTIIDVVVSWIGSSMLPQMAMYPARCGHPQSVPSYYYTWHTIQIIACGYISIILYVSALIAMKLKQNANSVVHAAQIKREATVTKRIAIVIVTTFLLQILPSTIYETNVGNLYFFDIIGPYVWALYALTPSVNVFIYALRTPEFQSKAKALFCVRNKVGQEATYQLKNVQNIE